MTLLYLFAYLSILIFLLLIGRKLIKYSSMPVHLRWELYPVAHEANKNEYGGSRYEEINWWEKESRKDHLAELLVMLEEIFLLKGVYTNNRKLWYFSYPFHLGLYLIIATAFLMLSAAVLNVCSVVSFVDPHRTLDAALFYFTDVAGFAGILLTFIGCSGLVVMRSTDSKYRQYNAPVDFINLAFIMVLDLSIFLTLILSNGSFVLSKEFIRNLVTFNFTPIREPFFAVHIILISLFLIYFPLTRMTHLFAKYFTYHKVRWEDEPNLGGTNLERRIKEALNFGVGWSAPHIESGKSWGEVATKLPSEVKR